MDGICDATVKKKGAVRVQHQLYALISDPARIRVGTAPWSGYWQPGPLNVLRRFKRRQRSPPTWCMRGSQIRTDQYVFARWCSVQVGGGLSRRDGSLMRYQASSSLIIAECGRFVLLSAVMAMPHTLVKSVLTHAPKIIPNANRIDLVRGVRNSPTNGRDEAGRISRVTGSGASCYGKRQSLVRLVPLRPTASSSFGGYYRR